VEIPSDFDQSACKIPAASSGYIQAIDYNLLTRIAESKDLLLRLQSAQASLCARNRACKGLAWRRGESKADQEINDAFLLGNQRTAHQDVEFSIKHLVEIAIRSLSLLSTIHLRQSAVSTCSVQPSVAWLKEISHLPTFTMTTTTSA
jgi:uncharacterized membrane protein